MIEKLTKRLKPARKRAGLTLTQAGERANISHVYWSEVENGHKIPNAKRLAIMGKAVGLRLRMSFERVR